MCVLGVGVVAHVALVHHTEEAIGAEELGEVFLCGITAVLIEAEDGVLTHLVVALGHGFLAQQLEEAGVELGVVAGTMVVEPQTIVHLRECPDVVAEEVIAGLEVVINFG